MKWYLLKVASDQDGADALGERMMDAGALSVTLSDGADAPLFEPPPGTTPVWRETICTAMFDSEERLHSLVELLGLQNADYGIEVLHDKDWVSETQNQRPELRFGDLWVVPPDRRPTETSAKVVLLEPGIAFGTGTHPTTALCLQWLADHPPSQQRVLDYGCGSGILAIAALKCGARSVSAVDHDPQALQATRQNALRNEVDQHLHLAEPKDLLTPGFELILANILLNPLIELKQRFASLLTQTGTLVLSGFTQDQSTVLIDAYGDRFEVSAKLVEEDWVCLTLNRSG